jgi:type IV pilus assembly protein PilE
MRTLRDLTVMELILATIAIVSVATIASSLYQNYAVKTRRAEAIRVLRDISLAQEKYRANHDKYGTIAQVWGGVTTSPHGYYRLTISNISPTTYSISAQAVGDQASDRESGISCADLGLIANNGNITQTPFVCWPLDGNVIAP